MAKPVRTVNPATAMQAVLRLVAGQLAYASEQVANLSDEELFVQAYSPDEAVVRMVPHHWLKLQREVIGDVAKYAKLCADAGIAERGQQLAEAQTDIVANLLEKVVGSLDLTPEQRAQLSPAIRREMTFVVAEDA